MFKRTSLFLLIAVSEVLHGQRLESLTADKPPPVARVRFSNFSCTRIDIRVKEEALDSLRQSPRSDVRASIRMEHSLPSECLLHLKGTTTFRHVDEKPSFTIKSQGDRLFGKYPKIHFNNCVSDETFLRDLVARALFKSLGIPVPDSGHVIVFLNNRYLGPYAWVQGVDASFLRSTLGENKGALFEGEHEDLTALLGRDPEARLKGFRKRAGSVPEVWLNSTNAEAVLAGELLVAHEDGCAFNANNYWMYVPRSRMEAIIFPHFMDAAFRSRSMIGTHVQLSALNEYIRDTSNRAKLVSKIERIVNDVEYWDDFFSQYSSYTSNLLAWIAPYEAKSLLDHCHEMTELRERVATNVRLLRNACALAEEESYFVKPSSWEWRTPQRGVVVDQVGSTITLRSLRVGQPAELTTSVVLRPGKYCLRVSKQELFQREKKRLTFKVFFNVIGRVTEVSDNGSEVTLGYFEVPPTKEPRIFDARETQITLHVIGGGKKVLVNQDGITLQPIPNREATASGNLATSP